MWCKRSPWWAVALVGLLGSVIATALAQDPAPTPSGKKPAARRPAEEVIREALARPIKLDYVETPLEDVVADLRAKLKIPIRFDRRALEDLGLGSDEPVTFSISGISAKSALELILKDFWLTYITYCEVLYITTPEEAEEHPLVRAYDVTDLVTLEDDPDGPPDFDSLIEVIENTIAPCTWINVGGTGSISPFQSPGIRALAMSQTEESHEQVAALLANLRALQRSPAPAAESNSEKHEKLTGDLTTIKATPTKGLTPAEKKIRRALWQPVDLQFVDTPLEDVVAYLRKQTGVPVKLDANAIADLGIEPSVPITVGLKTIELRNGLELMLRKLGLTWSVYADTLIITTADEAENHLSARIYDVSDLPAYRDKKGRVFPDFDRLIDSITNTIEPNNWADVGGQGNIESFENGGVQALVVNQTWQVHEEIEKLLTEVRKLRKRPLTKADLEKLPPQPQAQFPPQFSGFLQGHAKPGEEVKSLPPLEKDPLREAVVAGSNQFAFQLYRKLGEGKKGNLFFSSYSVATALAMVHAGARGETAREIADVLHLKIPQADVPKAFHSLQKAFPEKGLGCELNVANRLWCQQGYPFHEDFVNTLRNHFHSELAVVDFDDRKSTRRLINKWVEEKTQERIRELFPSGSMEREFRFLLTNAIYFKGRWNKLFPKNVTKSRVFYATGKKLHVPMMMQTGHFDYAENEDGQFLSLPYQGRNLSMLILLPRKQQGAFEKIEQYLTMEKIHALLRKLKTQNVELSLPRFAFETRFDLKITLQSLGMKKAFEETADFRGIHAGTEPLWLAAALHEAFVEVDEEGAKAAAATGIGGFGMAPKPVVFRADHPFLFMIYDRRTGSILFLGRLVEPQVAALG